ncbi:hypothetical protein [Ignavigranum ruoffiae]|uniref:hypothetical protein n=1 Tax=Ignavigranum ruoffiae TaxID=89093 RepID=UPI0024AE2464|nr:hypothetical protein [Ignavigranum ruoffiae]
MNEDILKKETFLEKLNEIDFEFSEEEIVLEEVKVQFSRTEPRPLPIKTRP